jgi:hypothetical protein
MDNRRNDHGGEAGQHQEVEEANTHLLPVPFSHDALAERVIRAPLARRG